METRDVNHTSSGYSRYSLDENGRGTRNGNLGQTEKILTLAGGALLSYWGIRKFNLVGLIGAAAGGALLYKGTTGIWPVKALSGKYKEVDIKSRLTIDKPREEVYSYWRKLENLPNFMSHLERVNELDEKRSHWTAKIPGGVGEIDWEAEIVQEEENSLIAWQSLPEADIHNSGEVRFEDAPDGNTIVEALISYRPPAGGIGEMAAQLINPAFEKLVKNDLKEFKNIMERGGGAKTNRRTNSQNS